MSWRMYEVPQQYFDEVCKDCKVMQIALNGAGYELGEMRESCAKCQKIYKFDAIVRGFHQKIDFGGKRNVGKKSTISEHEKKAIKELHESGKSIRDIAEMFNYNKNTIQKILKE